MKTKIQKYMAAALMIGAPMLWSSCADTWDEHYGQHQSDAQVGEGSLLSHIQEDESLKNFYRVISTIGGSETLNSPQQFTVWAPTTLTAEQADSVIAVFEEDDAKGVKMVDNRAITQFMQNHTALYARPVSAYTNDTIKMLSKKYMQLVGKDSESGTIGETPFYGMELCNNGILYKTDKVLTFFPNVREYIDRTENMSKLKEFIALYDEYTLDEQASVAGDIVDGKQEYLDSVTYLNNKYLNSYGYIQREDSVYTMIVPTDEVWEKEYEEYSRYYQFAPKVEHGDSLQDLYAKTNIMAGRYFNTSKAWALNFHKEDSLCNTQYSRLQTHYPRQNVYYDAFGADGILNGLDKVTCSNGEVYVDNKGVIDPHTTFFGRQDIDASWSRYYKIPTNSNNENTMTVSPMNYIQYVKAPVLDEEGQPTFDEEGNPVMQIVDEHKYSYVQVTANAASAQTELEYNLYNTLSGCYYNIYLVTVPGTNGLPSWMNMKYTTMNENGVHTGNGTYFENPEPFVKGMDSDETIGLSAEELEQLTKQSKLERFYRTNPAQVDTILVASAFQIPFSGYGLNDPALKITISSAGPSGAAVREKLYTRMLNLNEFILVPFATKEEAEAAKNDLNAINDAILMANRKK